MTVINTKKVNIIGSATPTQETNAKAYTDQQIQLVRDILGQNVNLQTIDQSTLVAAINEVNAKIPAPSANAYITNFYQSVL